MEKDEEVFINVRRISNIKADRILISLSKKKEPYKDSSDTEYRDTNTKKD